MINDFTIHTPSFHNSAHENITWKVATKKVFPFTTEKGRGQGNTLLDAPHNSCSERFGYNWPERFTGLLWKNMDWQLTYMTSLAARYTPGWETTHDFLGQFRHCSLFPVWNDKGKWVKILEISFGWWKIENLGSIWFLSIKIATIWHCCTDQIGF